MKVEHAWHVKDGCSHLTFLADAFLANKINQQLQAQQIKGSLIKAVPLTVGKGPFGGFYSVNIIKQPIVKDNETGDGGSS